MIHANTKLRLEEWLYFHDPFWSTTNQGPCRSLIVGNYRDTLGHVAHLSRFETL